MIAQSTRQQDMINTLLQLYVHRKTRRFGCGMSLPAGPLTYTSRHEPKPLSMTEEAYLIFSAIGRTGMNLGDMQYHRRGGDEDGQGMALMNLNSRTVPSACAAGTTRLFYTNDDGVYFVREASLQDGSPVVRSVKLEDGRLNIPRMLPIMLSFNQWYTNRPGTSFFIPVTYVTELYLNLLMVVLSEEYGYFFLDTDNGGNSCGLDMFRRSRGGHLWDDPAHGRVMTLRDLDSTIAALAMQEQGIMCQNMMLMEQALGLGGGMQSLGSGRHWLGIDPVVCSGLKFQYQYQTRWGTRPNPWGRPGVWESVVTPSTNRMDDAVDGVYASKFGIQGTFRGSGRMPWKNPELLHEVTPPSESARAAAIAFANYVLERYGRFPAHADAFVSSLGFQAHHLDLEFYDEFYPPATLPQAHRTHAENCLSCGEITREVLL